MTAKYAPSGTLTAFFDHGTKPTTAAGISAMLDEIRAFVLLAQREGSTITNTARPATRQPAPAPRPHIKPAAPAAVRQAPHTFIPPQAPPRPAPKAPAPEPVRTETPTLDMFNAMKGGMRTLFFNKNAKQILAEQSVRNSEERAAARASK